MKKDENDLKQKKHIVCQIEMSIAYHNYKRAALFMVGLIWHVQLTERMMIICHLNSFLFFLFSHSLF